MANRGRHRKRHVKCILHVSRYSESWISKVLNDDIINKIINYQYAHSGIHDLSVFEKNYFAGKHMNGFDWSNTLEGSDYWCKTMEKIAKYKRENMFTL